jgi:hypothetical protein
MEPKLIDNVFQLPETSETTIRQAACLPMSTIGLAERFWLYYGDRVAFTDGQWHHREAGKWVADADNRYVSRAVLAVIRSVTNLEEEHAVATDDGVSSIEEAMEHRWQTGLNDEASERVLERGLIKAKNEASSRHYKACEQLENTPVKHVLTTARHMAPEERR